MPRSKWDTRARIEVSFEPKAQSEAELATPEEMDALFALADDKFGIQGRFTLYSCCRWWLGCEITEITSHAVKWITWELEQLKSQPKQIPLPPREVGTIEGVIAPPPNVWGVKL